MAAIDAERHLLFGLLALQNGLINQVQLVAAFQASTLDKARALADHLVGRGDLDADDRFAVAALVARYLKKHGDLERSLAAIPAGRSTRESLARIAEPEVGGTLAHHRLSSGLDLLQFPQGLQAKEPGDVGEFAGRRRGGDPAGGENRPLEDVAERPAVLQRRHPLDVRPDRGEL
jgi:hypothetical protein